MRQRPISTPLVVWLLVAASLLVVSLTQVGVPAQIRTPLPSDTANYLPLQVGNQWLYERKFFGSSTWIASVVERVTAPNGRTYAALEGYFGILTSEGYVAPRRLVRSSRGIVTEFNPDGASDNLWYMLGAEVGTTWQIQLEPVPESGTIGLCVDGSTVTLASRSEVVTVPAGTFQDVVRLDFAPRCADAGIVSEWFAPRVGLIRRQEDSFSGPVVSELFRAIVGGVQFPRQTYSTSLSIDRPVYVNNLMPPPLPDGFPTVRGLFTVANATHLPIDFSFLGCKSVSVVVKDGAGNVVLRALGDDGGCCACDSILNVTLLRNTLVVPVSFRLLPLDRQPLPDGRYTVAVTLLTRDPVALRPSATATIEVQSTY